MRYRLPPAPSVTKLSRLVRLAVAAGVLFGCGMPASVTPAGQASAPALDVTEVYPDVGIFLVYGNARIRLGDPEKAATDAFPIPKGAQEIRQQAPFLDDSFQTRGWENALQSFGLITRKGKVAALIYTELDAEEQAIQAAVSAHQAAMPNARQDLVTTDGARYWFFERDRQRTMIYSARQPSGKVSLTLAIGDVALMNQYRMDLADASKDAQQLAGSPGTTSAR